MKSSTSIATRLVITWLIAFFGLSTALTAQQVTVQGTVVSEATGTPLQGATVMLEGGSVGTTTNASGEFSLSVPSANATLIVTHLGHARTQLALAGQTRVTVRLKADAVQLDAVVVVGYGTQRRRDVTGSVASVDAARLEDLPATDVGQAIQGVVPGVSISTGSGGAEQERQIEIRGQNSILANNSPLIVVDGIPYGGNLSELNQNDISSIDVLKDASSAAIYGSRGANGVILITTKKGTGAPRFTYDGYTGYQEAMNTPRMMTGVEFGEFKCTWLNAGNPCNGNQALMTRFLSASEREVLATTGGTDWYDLILRRGSQQQHNVAVSGGGGGTRYYVAASLLDVGGVAKNDEFGRYTLRVNLDQEVNSWFDLGTSTQLGWTDRSGEPADFSAAYHQNPLSRPFEEDGTQRIFPWPEDTFFRNPLQGLLAQDEDLARRVFTSNYVQVQLPVEGLSYRVNAGLDFGYRSESTYWGRDTAEGLGTLGSALTSDSETYDWTVENLLRYSRTSGAHTLDLTGLYSAQNFRYKERRLTARSFPGDQLTYWQPNVALALIPGTGFRESGMVSQMGRFNYSYDGRYLLTATARRDGSSVFGENFKYGVFPSVALGWNVSEEAFWPFSESMNNLKLRGSWGINGNQAISPYQTLSRLSDKSYVSGASPAPGYAPTALGNPDLRWEKSETVNLGADFGFLSDRLTGALDLYRTSTTDLILGRLIPSTHGIDRIISNLGEVQNRGIELSLSSINLETGDIRWTTDFNIAANRNRITDLYGDETDDLANRWFIGHPISVNYGYVHDGIWQAGEDIAGSHMPTAKPGDVRIRDANGDGRVTADDRAVHSDPNPRYLAGLRNTVEYGGLSLSLFVNSVQGATVWNEMLDVEDLVYAEARRNTILLDTWTPENRGNLIPAGRPGANNFQVGYYQDASFVRLKEATLSYALPQTLQSRLRLSNVRLYVSGMNLWTHTGWSGMDPELAGDAADPDDPENGDQLDIPLNRTLIAGINVGF